MGRGSCFRAYNASLTTFTWYSIVIGVSLFFENNRKFIPCGDNIEDYYPEFFIAEDVVPGSLRKRTISDEGKKVVTRQISRQVSKTTEEKKIDIDQKVEEVGTNFILTKS